MEKMFFIAKNDEGRIAYLTVDGTLTYMQEEAEPFLEHEVEIFIEMRPNRGYYSVPTVNEVDSSVLKDVH